MSLGERAVTHQIAHSPREPMSLLLTMGFHSRQHIPPPADSSAPGPGPPTAFSVTKEPAIPAEISRSVDGSRVC